MTPLELFERVRAHLLAQGEQAKQPSGACAYRTGDGRWLPSEDAWNSGDTASSRRRLALAAALTASGVPAREDVRAALVQLQAVHDDSDPATWAEALERMGERLAAAEAP